MIQTQDHNVPALRFPEFSGTWEKKNLTDFCEAISGYPVPGDEILESQTETKLLRGINITEGRIRHSGKIDRYFAGDRKSLEKFFVREGDIVVGMDGSKVGRNVAIVTEEDAGSFLIQRVARLRKVDANNLEFAYHHIFSNRFHRYVDRINTSSGIPHISLKQLREFPIEAPQAPEQQKIAAFLSSVDRKIAQLGQKKALLQRYKTGMMQKLFSQELRFKDAQGHDFPDWEEKRLGEFNELVHGDGDWILSQDISKDGEFKIVQLGNIGLGNFVEKPMKTLALKKFAELRGTKIYSGDLLINRMVDSNLYCCLMNKEGNFVTSVDVCWIRENQYFNNYFLMSLMLHTPNQRKLLSLSSGSGRVRISKKNLFNKFSFMLPSLKEQQIIADFLSSIDRKIDLVATELDHAKAFKKGLLQQMFI